MNYRINTYALWGLGVLVLVAGGLFVYTLVNAPDEATVAVELPEPSTPAEPETVINAKHQYADNMHTVGGMMQVPTPCHSITVEPFFVPQEGASSTMVELQFRTIVNGDECPTVPSDAPFRVTFDAPEAAEIRATWNGAPARLNLAPLAPGETLEDDFIFKG